MSDTPRPVVLIIDDDPQIRRFLHAGFDLEHFKVVEAETGKAGLRAATLRQADLIVVDLNLPDMDGASIVERIRSWSMVPIIVLSVRASDNDKVRLLECGADDYVVKPFSMVELLARARAAIRRQTRGAQGEPIVKLGPLSIDFTNRTVFIDGARVVLAQRISVATSARATRRQRVTHTSLKRYGASTTRTMHTTWILVRRLRRKIEQNPKQPRILVSELGVGYRLASGGESD
jgi:two-component system KDP operon response regulator KdpE